MNADRSSAYLLFSFLALCILCTSCVVIPVDYHEPGSRRNVSGETVERIVVGVTTEDDVVLELGEPDEVSIDQSSIRYRWSKVKVLWEFGAPPITGGSMTKDYDLLINFDVNNIVSKREFSSHWRK